MSTRCNIRLIDSGWEYNPVYLYHHSDGYPDFQMKKLQSFLKGAWEDLKKAGFPYWWDSQRVGALMIKNSAGQYDKYGLEYEELPDLQKSNMDYEMVPTYQPTSGLHGDIEYIYDVKFSQTDGKAVIECYEAMEEAKLKKATPVEILTLDFSIEKG